MAQCTKIRSGGANHSVVADAEEWKGDDYAYNNKNGGFDKLFHGCVPAAGF
jgi:hypothetical protein